MCICVATPGQGKLQARPSSHSPPGDKSPGPSSTSAMSDQDGDQERSASNGGAREKTPTNSPSPTADGAGAGEKPPKSGTSSREVTFEAKGKKKKKDSPPPDGHHVTFTVTIAKAIPTGMFPLSA